MTSRPNCNTFRLTLACLAATAVISACSGDSGGDRDRLEPPLPLLAGDVSCSGLTIGAIRLDSVVVPDNASCTLVGTTITGTLEIGANARLIAQNVDIAGDLKSDGAAVLSISGTSSVGGALQVQRGPGADLRDIAIAGDLQIDAMTGPVYAFGNKVIGNLLATANRGKLILAGNQMGGAMQCTDDLPAPTGAGNIASLKQDQCAGL